MVRLYRVYRETQHLAMLPIPIPHDTSLSWPPGRNKNGRKPLPGAAIESRRACLFHDGELLQGSGSAQTSRSPRHSLPTRGELLQGTLRQVPKGELIQGMNRFRLSGKGETERGSLLKMEVSTYLLLRNNATLRVELPLSQTVSANIHVYITSEDVHISLRKVPVEAHLSHATSL